MLPEYTLKNASFPTNGSAIILNAKAENGASSDDGLSSSSPVTGLIPLIAGMSTGDGI